MRAEHHHHHIGALQRDKHWLVIGLGMALLTAGISAGLAYHLWSHHKTILVFPNMDESMWISAHALSEPYVIHMSHFWLGLRLNVDPENVYAQHALLKQYLHPDVQTQWQHALDQEATTIAHEKLRFAFFPEHTRTDPGQSTAWITGTLQSWAQDVRVHHKKVRFKIAWKSRSGHPQLYHIAEEPVDPL